MWRDTKRRGGHYMEARRIVIIVEFAENNGAVAFNSPVILGRGD